MNKNGIVIFIMSLFSLILYFIDFPIKTMFSSALFFIWILGGFWIVKMFYKYQNYVIAIFILLNLVTVGYFFYVYSNYDVLLPEGPFDFSAYNLSNLHNINNVMYLIFSIIYFVLLINRRKILKSKKELAKNLKDIILEGLQKLHRIKSYTLFITIVLIVLVDILIFIGTFNIYKGPYGVDMDQYPYVPKFIRAFIGLLSFLVYVIVKMKNRMNTNFNVILVKLFFFFSVFFAILSYGSRGSGVGILILLLIFDSMTDKSKNLKFFNAFSSFLLILILIILWPIIRSLVYDYGLVNAFVISLNYVIFEASNSFENMQFRLIPMIPMTLFHFLYVSDLIAEGISLDYSTFFNLIPQQIPSAISSVIGYERPLNDNWRLANYFFHGGGFYIFANAYWNGGVIALGLFTFVIVQVLVWIEKFFKNHHIIYYLAYPLFIYLIPVNTFYGIQPFVRGLEYALIAIFLIYIYKRFRIKRI